MHSLLTHVNKHFDHMPIKHNAPSTEYVRTINCKTLRTQDTIVQKTSFPQYSNTNPIMNLLTYRTRATDWTTFLALLVICQFSQPHTVQKQHEID